MATRHEQIQDIHKPWILDKTNDVISISDGEIMIVHDIGIEDANRLIFERNGSIDMLLDLVEIMDQVDLTLFETYRSRYNLDNQK